MIPKRTFIIFTPINSSITQLNEFGIIMAINTAIRIIIKKYFSTNLKTLFIKLIFVKSIYKSLDYNIAKNNLIYKYLKIISYNTN